MVLTALKQTGKRLSIRANYHLGHYRNVVWLVGDGRSGTTWVSNLINWHEKYREMFEPFHPALIEDLKMAKLHQYLRPTDTDHEIAPTLHSIFSGKFYHPRSDALNKRLHYQGLLIKDIFANLLIGWVHSNVPNVKKVFVIRNPFAVALSKQKRVRGIWMDNPKSLLTQQKLANDYISPFQDIIQATNMNFIERQLLIWAIIHYVPLKQIKTNQIKKEDIYILFYEDLFTDPYIQFKQLFKYLFKASSDITDSEFFDKINRPSRSPGKDSNILLGKSPINTWKNELSANQIDQGLKILETFGLEKIYGSASIPSPKAMYEYLS